MDDKTYAKYLRVMLEHLYELDKDQFPTIRKYLKENQILAVKWFAENIKGDMKNTTSQYMQWTEQSLDEIDFYSGIDINQK